MSTRKIVRSRRSYFGVRPEIWALLADQPLPDQYNRFLVIGFSDRRAKELWDTYGDGIVRQHAKRFPGMRPSYWWRFDAPRISGDLLAHFAERGFGEWVADYPQWRGRAGGQGEPAVCPASRCGIPMGWLSVEPGDPPVFESQAAYLKRHKLLLPGERPPRSALEPETLPRDLWP